MSEKEKQIIETFEKIIPDLTELDQERLLAFGEGIAFRIKQESEKAIKTQEDKR